MDEKMLTIDLNSQKMIAKAREEGVETMYDRKEGFKAQCGFGLQGVCCRICGMGPCRISPKTPRGLCGADEHTIVGRNFARMVAGGTAAHSDHARDIAHTLALADPNGNYKIRDEAKLITLAKEWDVETEGRDIYDVAHEVAEIALMEFGKPFGVSRFIKNAPEPRQKIWKEYGIEPRAIDREIATIMHSTHIGCTADIDSLIHMSLRTSMADGWAGSMIGTRLSDILFGTPVPRRTEANLAVLDENKVNIILHGHEPSLSEMIVLASEEPDLVALAKEVGADGINLAGMCCTGNEITMRHGVKIAGDFHQQELAIVTGAVEAVIVDVQCIFPALARVADCYHTKFVTTSPKAKITGSTYIEFREEQALQDAKAIVKEAILNFKNRDKSKVLIPELKSGATVGYSVDAIVNQLDRVVNSHIDPAGTVKPLTDCLKSGVLRGAAGVVGCNNAKGVSNEAHVTIMKELIKNDIIVVTTGCGASAAAKFGLMEADAAEKYAGKGLATVCKLVGIPPVLHMGSCVDISRILDLVGAAAKYLDMDMCDLPVVGVAPEWMSEKAVAIGCYVVASGIDTYLGIMPPIPGSSKAVEILTSGLRDKVGAAFTVNTNPKELAATIIEDIEKKRVHFEALVEEKMAEKAEA
ncbi:MULTISPECIES: anaerobic carbon-monoxide dehydrogenase catalytic subunit [unclassified Clostridioides]|uniref:anaerobic carbon-monoxide dehydrogenase catalytic subunit n=1 Tax=unclassified Clostridioides TaxID=2635829 RepID=UPI001D117D32|nr:anaerobic carbon-monoxide dehydrogenase catalytic subunit [Clostridioides sp. ES-S-0171-01]MCC0686727.1 anaerobic carbon-monoxide dehydrogenase catalytic subunit [Clostridioides sp. ES-S-0056-01]MCC0713757.1 anaerobic carbon-monoxide dehydrogenase catalytic subunit [Clostridioides sp. ES-S-0077-01]UDN55304.1 anaerobic carbon-monoxide dehydrogenase catalytic subunit [Clostridioides sp. ES-S-0054-01]